MRAPSEAVTHDGTPYPASSAIRDWAKASDELAIAVVVLVCSVFFGVVVGVGAGLAVVGVWWGDPFGGAVGVFSGFPAAGGEQAVMGAAGEGEVSYKAVICPLGLERSQDSGCPTRLAAQSQRHAQSRVPTGFGVRGARAPRLPAQTLESTAKNAYELRKSGPHSARLSRW
jgi:hypothetical protein